MASLTQTRREKKRTIGVFFNNTSFVCVFKTLGVFTSGCSFRFPEIGFWGRFINGAPCSAPLPYERVPIDVAAGKTLPRVFFFRSQCGARIRAFLRFVGEGCESARERGATSDVGKSISLL